MCLLAKPQASPLDLLERSKHELQLQLMGDAVIMCLPQQDYICILNSTELMEVHLCLVEWKAKALCNAPSVVSMYNRL